MPDKKLPLVIGVSLVLLAGLFALNYYFQNSIKQVSIDAEISDTTPGAGDDLLASNRKAIEEAANSADLEPRPITADDHVIGELSAPVKIIAYLDYSCVFCADLAASLKAILADHGDKTVLAVRHFPMRTNAGSFAAALALECADSQSAYWEMHDRVYEAIRAGTSSAEIYRHIAKELGLDLDEFNECAAKENFREKIIDQAADANAIGVIGTPTMYINDEIHPGAVPLDDFTDSQGAKREGLRSIIERMLAGKKE